MPCVTYLNDSDIQRSSRTLEPVADKDLIEMLGEINSFPGQVWSLRKGTYHRRRFLRRPTSIERFSLYSYVSGPEWQCIHFPTGTTGNGTFDLTRSEMATFLLGFRMGWSDRGNVT